MMVSFKFFTLFSTLLLVSLGGYVDRGSGVDVDANPARDVVVEANNVNPSDLTSDVTMKVDSMNWDSARNQSVAQDVTGKHEQLYAAADNSSPNIINGAVGDSVSHANSRIAENQSTAQDVIRKNGHSHAAAVNSTHDSLNGAVTVKDYVSQVNSSTTRMQSTDQDLTGKPNQFQAAAHDLSHDSLNSSVTVQDGVSNVNSSTAKIRSTAQDVTKTHDKSAAAVPDNLSKNSLDGAVTIGDSVDDVNSTESSNHSEFQNTPGKTQGRCEHNTCSADDSLVHTDISNDDDFDGMVVTDDENSPPDTVEEAWTSENPSIEKYDITYKKLEEDFRKYTDVDEPEQEILERWGFFDLKTMGELDAKRNKDYEDYMEVMNTRVPHPDKQIPREEKEALNDELEAFLQDDHRCVVGLAVVCGCGCGLWKKKARPSRPPTEPPTPDSYCHPPNYSRCSSFHQPPPYAEVTAKPDLYPLVISYTENGKTGGSYLMVQYFRNYIMRPVGSLSATSTADSLSSSLFCNATNEANSLIPPPYSSAPGSVEQITAPDTPNHQADAPTCTVSTETERRATRPSLCGLSNVSSLSVAPQDSPPQATTPTLGKSHQSSSSSSSRNKYRGRGWLSRSAPTTPSSRLTPATTFPSGESSPLLAALEDNNF